MEAEMRADEIQNIIVDLSAARDGKDGNTALSTWINLANGQQVAHKDLSYVAGLKDFMVIDQRPSRSQIEAGSQLRTKWNPHGHDTYEGTAVVQIYYNDGVRVQYTIPGVKMKEDVEWYVFPFAGSGTPIP